MMNFDRKYRLTVGPVGRQGIVITDLQFAFTVVKTVTKEPNKMEGSVYNLSQDSRKHFVKDNIVKLEIAYGTDPFCTIFVGSIVNVESKLEGADLITYFDAGDAYSSLRDAYTVTNFPANSSVQTIIKAIAKDLGLAIGTMANGNIGPGKGLNRVYKKGYSVTGSSKYALDTLIESNGLAYLIQDGTLTVLPVGTPTKESISVIDPTTGLIGSPEYIEIKADRPKEKRKKKSDEPDQDAKKSVEVKTTNGIQFKTLMNPDIRLSRRVMIESNFVYPGKIVTIQKFTHKGDFRGNDWYTEAEGLL